MNIRACAFTAIVAQTAPGPLEIDVITSPRNPLHPPGASDIQARQVIKGGG